MGLTRRTHIAVQINMFYWHVVDNQSFPLIDNGTRPEMCRHCDNLLLRALDVSTISVHVYESQRMNPVGRWPGSLWSVRFQLSTFTNTESRSVLKNDLTFWK